MGYTEEGPRWGIGEKGREKGRDGSLILELQYAASYVIRILSSYQFGTLQYSANSLPDKSNQYSTSCMDGRTTTTVSFKHSTHLPYSVPGPDTDHLLLIPHIHTHPYPIH